eukprot:6689628-Prymnesium_polylepis.2
MRPHPSAIGAHLSKAAHLHKDRRDVISSSGCKRARAGGVGQSLAHKPREMLRTLLTGLAECGRQNRTIRPGVSLGKKQGAPRTTACAWRGEDGRARGFES